MSKKKKLDNIGVLIIAVHKIMPEKKKKRIWYILSGGSKVSEFNSFVLPLKKKTNLIKLLLFDEAKYQPLNMFLSLLVCLS